MTTIDPIESGDLIHHVSLPHRDDGSVSIHDIEETARYAEGLVEAQGSRDCPSPIIVGYGTMQFWATLTAWRPGVGWKVPDHVGRFGEPGLASLADILKSRLGEIGVTWDGGLPTDT